MINNVKGSISNLVFVCNLEYILLTKTSPICYGWIDDNLIHSPSYISRGVSTHLFQTIIISQNKKYVLD